MNYGCMILRRRTAQRSEAKQAMTTNGVKSSKLKKEGYGEPWFPIMVVKSSKEIKKIKN